jgi:AraC-like DNA-binding protein
VIHIVIDGKGVLEKKGRQWQIRKGQMFILFPDEETTYEADKDAPWYYCWIGFHGDMAQKLAVAMGFTDETPVVTFSQIERAEQIVKDMLSNKKLTLDGQMKRSAGMFILLSDMIAAHEVEASGDSPVGFISYAQYAARYINNHFYEKIRIQDLAKHIGISRSYLVKLMKQEIGMSPQEYLIETRMRKASDLLGRSNVPVRSVAAECGYDDALAFSKVFKSRFGLNPSEYRHAHMTRKEAGRQDISAEEMEEDSHKEQD